MSLEQNKKDRLRCAHCGKRIGWNEGSVGDGITNYCSKETCKKVWFEIVDR